MRYLLLCILAFFTIHANAQLDKKVLKEIKAPADLENIHSEQIHSDFNSTASIIFIKKLVRKHKHEFHTEYVTILEGKGEMFLGGDVFEIKPGDQIVIPEGMAHGVITRSKKPLKVLSIQAPQFEGFDRVFLED